MKNFRSFIVIPVLGWLTFFIACTDDEVIPQLPRLTPEQQLLYFLEDSSLFTETRQVIGTNYYFRVEDTIPGDTGTIMDGPVIYFHSSLSFLSVTIDSIYVDTDSASIDTVRQAPLIFQPFDFTEPSLVGRIGANALWPVGLDQVLQNTDLREGETYTYFLPPTLAYDDIGLNDQLANKPVQIGIRIDSIKNVDEVIVESRANIIQYIAAAALRDTTVVPGGPVTVLSGITGDPVYFKRLGPPRGGIGPLYNDSVQISFNYRFVTDSLNGGDLGALEISTVNGYSFLVDAISTLQGLQTGILSMRTSETALMIFGPELAYREAVCFVPGLRTSNTFYGDRDGFSSNLVKQYLLENKIVPEYAFQTEPYRSYIFEVTLDQVY